MLRDNLFGLELDPRCTQIAAFALALAAWKYPGEDGQPLGYRPLPTLNIACSGQGVAGKKEEWVKFANGDLGSATAWSGSTNCSRRPRTSARSSTPEPGPRTCSALGFDTLKGTVERALTKIEARDDPDLSAVGVAAQGITAAADLLGPAVHARRTNVPYLGRGKQGEILKEYIETHHAIAKADLATAFVLRCLQLCAAGGATALVTPQNWLFLDQLQEAAREVYSKRATVEFVLQSGRRSVVRVSACR